MAQIKGELSVWRLIPQWRGHSLEASPDMQHAARYFTPVKGVQDHSYVYPAVDWKECYHIIINEDTANPVYTEEDLVVLKDYTLRSDDYERTAHGFVHYRDEVWEIIGSYCTKPDEWLISVRKDVGLTLWQRLMNEQANESPTDRSADK